MKKLFTFVCLLGLLTTSLSQTHCAEPKVVLEETFTTPLSKDWHWGWEHGRPKTAFYEDLNQDHVVMGR